MMNPNRMTTNYLHQIIDQNQQLHQKLQTLQQVQHYAQTLLKKYALKQQQNNQLQKKYQHILIDFGQYQKEQMLISERHKNQIRMVINQHDNYTKNTQNQLRLLKNQSKEQIIIFQELQDNITKVQSQKNRLKQKLNHIQTHFQQQKTHLKQTIKLTQTNYQDLIHQHQLFKSKTLKQNENLINQFNHLKLVVLKQQRQTIQQQKVEISKLKDQNNGLRSYNQEIVRNANNKQRTLSQIIKQIKIDYQSNNQLNIKQLSTLSTQLKSKTDLCQRLDQQNGSLHQENSKLKNQVEKYYVHSDHLCDLLQQSENQNQNLTQRLKYTTKSAQNQAEKLRKQFFQQRDHNLQLRKVINDKQMTINQKLREIQDLFKIIDQIEGCLKSKEKQLNVLTQEIQQMEISVSSLNKVIEAKSQQIRKWQQNNKKQKVSIQELHISNSMFKKQLIQLQTLNHSYKRQLLNPRVMNSEVQQRIQALIKSFQKQKQNLLEQHRIQKQKIRSMCQFQIKEKNLQFLRTVEFYQQQLRTIN